MQYAIVSNSHSLVALPSTAVLNDIAFDKGWRVLHQDLSSLELDEWKSRFNLEVMDDIKFYLDYLVDDEMTEEDTAYIEACMAENFYEAVHADLDEEDFDENFTTEELNESEEDNQ